MLLIKQMFSRNSLRCLIQKSIFFKSSGKITQFKMNQLLVNHQHRYNFNIRNKYSFSSQKQKIIQGLQKFQQQLTIKQSTLEGSVKKSRTNQFQQKQQKILKDFIELTQQSFNEHLDKQISQPYHLDPHVLLMIISTLQDEQIIRQNLKRLYPYLNILSNEQLQLFFQLMLSYRPKQVPLFPQSRSLEGIESILLMLSQIYPGSEKCIEWLKQIPLYKGNNIYMISMGFFSIYQKIDKTIIFHNQKIIQKSMERIINLSIEQDDQTRISIAILALQSKQTANLGEQFIIQTQSIDYDQVDPFKLQLYYIQLQKYLAAEYQQIRKENIKKNKFKVIQQDEQGQIKQTVQTQYLNQKQSSKKVSYQIMKDLQRYNFIQNQLKKVIIKIMDLNWSQYLKLNLLIQYWSLFQLFDNKYPWNLLKNKIINFTNQKSSNDKLKNLSTEEIITILQIMQKQKINKSQLLMKFLAFLVQHIQNLQSKQYIRLSKVCVTYVRQCQDYLISLRGQIQKKKFIFNNQEIDQLNKIYKRVLVLFPRPIVK